MKRTAILLFTILMASCHQPNGKVPAIDPSNFDETVALNDDFYQYATGGWQRKHPLKPEYARYGAFDVLAENNEIRINELFSRMAAEQYEAGSVNQKIADLYKLGLDSVRLNAEGAAPVQARVAELLAVADRAQLMEAIASMQVSVGAPFFGFGPEADLMDSNMNVLYLSQAGINMGNRDYYLEEENEAIRAGYREYLGKLFTLAGMAADEVPTAVESVMRIETRLAKHQRSNVELRDIQRMYNPMSYADLRKNYPDIDWETLFGKAGLVIDRLIVCQPEYIAAVDALLKDTPVSEIRYYLAADYLGAAAPYLSDEFYAASFDFFGRVMSGKQEPRPRWKRAMNVPNSILSEAVGEMYVAKYFPEREKQRMLELVGHLQRALGEHIDALDWMSGETKARAREKLAAFTVKIGYPDKWKDYSALTIDPQQSYWANIVEAYKWQNADQLAKVGRPVDREEWFMPPQMVNAYYNPTTNEICFPAAILQPPFYNPDADDAVNYGAIGVVIGHEMTHGFDDQGRQFDKEGNMNNWWTEADAEAFKAKTDILVKQFDAIEVLPAQGDQPALHANGALSLGENIADQGGLRVAYTALQNVLAENPAAPVDGFTPEQRFYLAYATLWGQNIRDEEIARLTKLDVHSLGKWRVNATLRNLQSFYDAFGITDGAMFLPEEERVIIW